MTGKRHDSIGIKQVIRLEWMEKTVCLVLAGLDPKTVRIELHGYLAERQGSGAECTRGETSRSQIVSMLMNIWAPTKRDLLAFRKEIQGHIQRNPADGVAVHWGMISAVYPFWYNVARQTGRLLALQDQVTQNQIISRMKEQYGDRQTVSRYTRNVIRSFVAWGVLKDSGSKGCYERFVQVDVKSHGLAILMFESVLYASPNSKEALGLLANNPAFFPFRLPVMSGVLASQPSPRLVISRFGLDEEFVELRGDLDPDKNQKQE